MSTTTTTTTAELFDKLVLSQAVLETHVRMCGTNEECFYLHLVNGRTIQFEVDEDEMLTTIWEKWDKEDESNYLRQDSYPLNKAEIVVSHLAQGDFIVRFTEDSEDTPSGKTRQYAEVTNEAGDEIGLFDWLTDNPEEFEPELYKKAALESGWELTDITPQGGIARLAL